MMSVDWPYVVLVLLSLHIHTATVLLHPTKVCSKLTEQKDIGYSKADVASITLQYKAIHVMVVFCLCKARRNLVG